MFVLQRKLIKQISQQLDAKQKVDPKESLSDLRRYPSLSNLLTLAGVSSSLIIVSTKQRLSRLTAYSFVYCVTLQFILILVAVDKTDGMILLFCNIL